MVTVCVGFIPPQNNKHRREVIVQAESTKEQRKDRLYLAISTDRKRIQEKIQAKIIIILSTLY
jgi:hypothetical protein